MKRIVVFSGAGMSAESGLSTFRDAGGLWETYNIEDVATPEAWERNPKLVLEFYNKRRRQIADAMPNAAHLALVELEKNFDVRIVTQNIDDLHERAGSSSVLHLHGQIFQAKTDVGDSRFYEVKEDIRLGDTAPNGRQLRPHVVWFGEPVPEYERAISVLNAADIVLIIGTSLNVYPAAGLVLQAPKSLKMYLIDPADVANPGLPDLSIIRKRASEGVPQLVEELLSSVETI